MQSNSNLPARKLSDLRTEPPLWQGNPVQYLINDKYPLNYLLKLQHLPGQTSHLDEATIQGIAAYCKELEAKTQQELAPLIHDARNREAERIRRHEEKIEAEAFFNLASANADFGYWSRISYWTLEEAVALSLGKNPKIVSSERLRTHKGNSPFIATYSAKLEEVRRAQTMGQLWEKTIPMVFVLWAERVSFEMPADLVQRNKALGVQVVDWKKAYEKQLENEKELRSERDQAHQRVLDAGKDHIEKLKEQGAFIERLANDYKDIIAKKDQAIANRDDRIAELEELFAKPPLSKGTEVGPRERESLLKLVLGMAMKGYSFDPKATRSSEITEIANDLVEAGLPLEADTVRKYLNEAKALFSDELNRTEDR